MVSLPRLTPETRQIASYVVLIPEGTVEGKVVGADDMPVEGAWVVIDPGFGGLNSNAPITAFTAADGSFRLLGVMVEAVVDGTRFHASGLSPGTYVLTALTDAREGDAQKVVVRPGPPTPVTMTSRGTATLIGTVRDFTTRAPIAGMRCAPFPRTSDAVGSIFNGPDQEVATDARGMFRMTTSGGAINILCIGAGASASRNIAAARGGTTTVDMFSVMPTPNPGTIDVGIDWVQPRLTTVAQGGAADLAGLIPGDSIVAVDGASVDELGNGSIMQLITQRPAGTKASLTIVRGAEQRSIVVTVRSSN